jgi:dihydrofolate reductase
MKVVADISMSLDGFVTGPDPDLSHGLGRGGEPLHTWAISSDDPVDASVLKEATERSGAVVMGRRLFDIIDGPHGWSDEMGYGASHAASPPFFVVTHSAPAPDDVRLDLDFTFVTDGVGAAIERARSAVAGAGAAAGDVVIMGGGDVVRQSVDEGLADELVIHLSPIILGAGTPLFAGSPRRELTQLSAQVSSTATHITYRVD